jgi:hypothetical protein
VKGNLGRGVAGAVLALASLTLFLPVAAGAADVQLFGRGKGLPGNWITSLAFAPGGDLWVGTGDAGVHLLSPATGKVRSFRASEGLPSDAVVSIALYGGNVYVGTSAGIAVFDGKGWSQVDKVGNVTLRNVRLASSPDGKELWACSVYLAGGTVRLDAAGWKFMGGEGRGLFNDIQGFGFLPDGVLMGAGSGTAYVHKGEDVSVLAEGLPPVNVFSAGVLGGKWLLGTSRGLYRFEGKWVPVPLPGAISGEPVFAIATSGGRTAIGTAAGLVLLGAGEMKTLDASGGLPSSRVAAVAVSGDLVAAGTANGLALIRGWVAE